MGCMALYGARRSGVRPVRQYSMTLSIWQQQYVGNIGLKEESDNEGPCTDGLPGAGSVREQLIARSKLSTVYTDADRWAAVCWPPAPHGC